MDVIIFVALFAYFVWHGRRQAFWQLFLKEIFLCGAVYLSLQVSPLIFRFVQLFIPYPGHSMDVNYFFYPQALLPYLDTAYYRCISSIICLCLFAFAIYLVFLPFKQGPSRPVKRGLISFTLLLLLSITQTILLLFFTFSFLSFLGFPKLQDALATWPIANLLLRQAPYLSEHFFTMWFMKIAVPF